LLILLGVWLLLNVLFVIVVVPPRKSRRPGPASKPGTNLAPAPIDQNAYADSEKASLRHIIVSVGMGTFFVLSPLLLEAIAAVKRLFRRGRG
jgi:hypothetical protein